MFLQKIEELVNRNAKDDHQKSLNQWVLGLMAVMHSNDSREAIEAFYSTARKLFASLSSQVMTPEKRAKLNIQEEDMAFIDFIILRPRLDDIDDNVFQKLIDRFYYCVDAVLKKPAETTFERPKNLKISNLKTTLLMQKNLIALLKNSAMH
ncbi:MAG: hypothetical protein HWD59_14690 [Coxiellaceae bacterium]|nr:MAG: hypothetical protein HWD59_14690 [Coxiellaceae bacterium]